jgi:UDP-N-acetylglucosamine--N-acetylmuramyl-(pentapeptide) pyrophosphoryl-undecaprenol N-acetylglucosamine transferase
MEIRPDRDKALEFFGLRGDLPTVLIFGGSRGARSINDAAKVAARNIVERRNVQFVFLAGELDYERVKSDLSDRDHLVRVYPFLEEIQHAYSIADVAVSRSGASAVFELAAFGVPTIFVPYPYAADDHQRGNVQELLADGAVQVVDDADLDGASLQAIIETLLDDDDARQQMSRAMKAWAKTDAADEGAEAILAVAGHNKMARASVSHQHGTSSAGTAL